MEGRKQFTFYRSYYEAIKKLSAKRRLGLLEAIVTYGLDGIEPAGLDDVQEMVFTLIRPTLDAAHKMAAGGRKSKVGQRSDKGSAKEGEKETEIEKENEKENETERYSCAEEGFERFWDAFPVKEGKAPALEAWKTVRPQAQAVMEGLQRWKRSAQWTRDEKRFIPRPAKFLLEKQYLDHPRMGIPKGASGELGAAELEAIEKILREEG